MKTGVVCMILKGKISIVTGSSKGIGKATVIELAKEGSNVVINYNKSEEEAMAVKRQVEEFGVEALVVKADVSKFKDAKHLIDTTVDTFGHIDILVNNAGVFKSNFIQNLPPEEWRFMIDVNLTSMYNCTHEAVKHMIKQRQGRIINVTSIYGISGYAFPWYTEIGISAYAAAKAGIIGFTKALAKELSQYHINVVAVAPGATLTDSWKQSPQELINRISEHIPLRRFAEPKEIAEAIVFVAKADYMTGNVIVVDGGVI